MTSSSDSRAREEIIAREKELLEQWSAGNPLGYARAAAPDITYFDDIGASDGIKGREAVRRYVASLEGQIPPHAYEMIDPEVQLAGEVGVLTFRYQPKGPDGAPLTRWRATSVYRRDGDDWVQIHAHWAIQKNA